MARSHHRKKHKTHLRQYQHSQEGVSRIKKTKVTLLFTLLGAATGFAIGFFASGSVIALIAGSLLGGVAGYFIGKKMDEPVRD